MINISRELKQVIRDQEMMEPWFAGWEDAFMAQASRKLDHAIMTGGKKMTITDRMREYLFTQGTWPGYNTGACILQLATLVDEALADREGVQVREDKPLECLTLSPGALAKHLTEYLLCSDWVEINASLQNALLGIADWVDTVSGDAEKILAKRAFIEGYAKRSGLTVEQLHELGQYAYPCDCGEAGCKGWRMDDPNRLGNVLDRALAAQHAPGPVQDETYFLIRRISNGETHVTQHDKEGLLEAIQPLQCAKTRLWYSDTGEWQGCFLVVRGEIAALDAKYSSTCPQYVVGWEIE